MDSTKQKQIFVGTSGFSYKDWLGNFYPQFCPQKDFLRFYSRVLRTVEIDSSFYRIPSVETVKRWKKVTPDDFRFSAKFPRTVTHEGDIDSRISNASAFIETISHLDDKLGPLLLQFPYSFKPENGREILDGLLSFLPRDVKIALEIRNKKWLSDEFFGLLEKHNIALCLVDHPWMPRKTAVTADFLYVRFLGDRKKISSDFSYIRFDREEDLDWWARLIDEYSSSCEEIYAYINNHYSGHSPTTAKQLIDKLI
jgi:uncharacterized protein YecE (DUF72 family)